MENKYTPNDRVHKRLAKGGGENSTADVHTVPLVGRTTHFD